MLDRDGIERPDLPDQHAIEFRHKKNRYKVTAKTYKRRNPVYLFFCFIIRYIAVIALSLIGKIKFHAKLKSGRKYYRQAKKTGAVIVCNHVHYFDVVLTASMLSPFKKVWITTIQANMDIPGIGWFERVLGAVPIPEDRTCMKYFIDAIDAKLQKKQFVAFMPECALWLYYRDLRPFKMSAFRFAAKNNVPVLPVTLTFDVRKKIKRNGEEKLKYKLLFDYLPPIYPQKDQSVPENTEYMLNSAHAQMAENIEKRNKENHEKHGI